MSKEEKYSNWELPQLSKNLKLLRELRNESREQIATQLQLLGKKSTYKTIASYELGNRKPKDDILEWLAQHFDVTKEMLLFDELTADIVRRRYQKIDLDKMKAMAEAMLFVIASPEALANSEFKIAHFYLTHLSEITPQTIQAMSGCKKLLYNAYKTFGIIEGAANLLMLIALEYTILGSDSSLVAEDLTIKDMDNEFEKLISRCSVLRDDFLKENEQIFDECLAALRKHPDMIELTEYYIALRYVLNMVSNQLSYGMNAKTGIVMMYEFSKLGNQYANKFIEAYSDFIDQ